MTALKEYARLESTGVWRETPEAQRRDVFVAFGDASLVISDKSERALAHWSLAAVGRVNPGQRPAVFAPDPEAAETLEIDDEAMVAAIEKVRHLIARRRPHPGRLRGGLLSLALLGVLGFMLFWLPEALLRHTVAVVPPATRAEIGQALLVDVVKASGQPCHSSRGDEALARLADRLLGPGAGQIVVLPGGVRAAEHLPGGLILVNRALVEDFESPDVVAGYVLAEATRRALTDPMERLLRDAGVLATFRLLTSGELPAEALDAYAKRTLAGAPQLPPIEPLLARFAAAQVPSAPFAYAVDVTGESTLALIEADPLRGAGSGPALSDADWVILQGICGE